MELPPSEAMLSRIRLYSDYNILHPVSHIIIERMGDVGIGSVCLFTAGHCYEQTGIAVNNLRVPNDKTIVQNDCSKCLEFIISLTNRMTLTSVFP